MFAGIWSFSRTIILYGEQINKQTTIGITEMKLLQLTRYYLLEYSTTSTIIVILVN